MFLQSLQRKQKTLFLYAESFLKTSCDEPKFTLAVSVGDPSRFGPKSFWTQVVLEISRDDNRDDMCNISVMDSFLLYYSASWSEAESRK